ncbi:Nucleolar Complex 2 protein [Tieghemiomyces parasiticus]|uniref:Nucleolar Complex 2 protein n=1 Tax=Tieghemiomyces parasiticus TaxID=78921 RepID=A0A9W8DTQ3_9FUNG|nr:Nucleolar Complex 2 protein [Tieghemiomyces parasiticus]
MGKATKSMIRFNKKHKDHVDQNRKATQKVKRGIVRQQTQRVSRQEQREARDEAQVEADQQRGVVRYPRGQSGDLESFALTGQDRDTLRFEDDDANDIADGFEDIMDPDSIVDVDSQRAWSRGHKGTKPSAPALDDEGVEFIQFEQVEDDEVEQKPKKKAPASSTKPSKAHKKHVSDALKAIKEHRRELDELKKRDPAFFEFLQKNDGDLLEFGQDDDDDDEDDEDGEDDEDDEGENSSDDDDSSDDMDMEKEEADSHASRDQDQRPTILTPDMVKSWEQAITTDHSLVAFNHLLSALYSCTHADVEETKPKHVKFTQKRSSRAQAKVKAYEVDSPTAYNKLIVTSLRVAPGLLQHYVPSELGNPSVQRAKGKSGLGANVTRPNQSLAWSQVSRPVRLYGDSLLRLFQMIEEPNMVRLLLQETTMVLPYLMCTRRFVRALRRVVAYYMSTPTVDETVQVAAFLAMRHLATYQNEDDLEEILRIVYRSFVQRSALMSPHTVGSINLLRQFGVEIYGLYPDAAYRMAFVYLRQLAIHLRTALNVENKKAFAPVHNWQFVHCLRFWTELVCTHYQAPPPPPPGTIEPALPTAGADLSSLVYPLVQIISGAVRLVPTHTYFPFRFHCVRLLTRIARDTQQFIPVASYLLEVYASPELSRRLSRSAQKPLDFEFHIKCPRSYEHTVPYIEGVHQQLIDLLLEFLATQATNIAFPELTMPITSQLVRFAKKSRLTKVTRGIADLVEKTKEHCRVIEQARSTLNWAPGEYAQLRTFLATTDRNTLPLVKYYNLYEKLRQKQLETLRRSAEQEEADEAEAGQGRPRVEPKNSAEAAVIAMAEDGVSSDDDDLY